MPSLPPAPLVSIIDRRLGRGGRRPFYGYVMLAATTLTTAATSPGQSFVVGSFSEAIRADLGISLSGFSAAYMLATFCASLPLTLIGRLGDRFGTRAVMAWVGLLLGLACGFVGVATAAAKTAVSSLELGDAAATTMILGVLTVAFFLLRFLGQGALGLVSSHALAMWFERRLGMMESIRHLGMPMAIAVLPALLIGMIEALGWRGAYAVLGAGVWVVVVPLALLLHVNRPEDLGQRIDGEGPAPEAGAGAGTETVPGADAVGGAAPEAAIRATPEAVNGPVPAADALAGPGAAPGQDTVPGTAAPSDPADQFTLRQALRTRAYWIVTASMVLSAAVGTAFVFHTQPMMDDLGLSVRAAAAVVGTLGVVSLLVTVPCGYLTDRFRPRYLLALTGVLLTAACVAYGMAGRVAHLELLGVGGALLAAHAAYVMLALSQALLFVLASPIFARFFGRRHHGAIRGSLTTFMVIGTSAGPLVFAAWRDVAGDFIAAYLMAGVVSLVLAVWATRLERPRLG